MTAVSVALAVPVAFLQHILGVGRNLSFLDRQFLPLVSFVPVTDEVGSLMQAAHHQAMSSAAVALLVHFLDLLLLLMVMVGVAVAFSGRSHYVVLRMVRPKLGRQLALAVD